jgi:hypothetical protein
MVTRQSYHELALRPKASGYFHSCLLQQSEAVGKSVWLLVAHELDTSVDDRHSAGEARLVCHEHLGALQSHTMPSGERDSVLLSMHGSGAGLLRVTVLEMTSGVGLLAIAAVVAVGKAGWGPVVALHQNAAVPVDNAADMKTITARSLRPEVGRLHQGVGTVFSHSIRPASVRA